MSLPIGDPPWPQPDGIAVGSWSCRCGAVKFYDLTGSGGVVSLAPRCLYCGDSAEVLVLPADA